MPFTHNFKINLMPVMSSEWTMKNSFALMVKRFYFPLRRISSVQEYRRTEETVNILTAGEQL